MTARTALTPVALARDAGVTNPAAVTVDAANGNTVADPGPFKVILLVTNTDGSAHTCTVRATGSGVTAAGAAQVNPAPSNTVYAQGTVGDLVVSVPATSGSVVIGPFSTDRFAQSDGSLSLDWSSATGMKVAVLRTPYVIPS